MFSTVYNVFTSSQDVSRGFYFPYSSAQQWPLRGVFFFGSVYIISVGFSPIATASGDYLVFLLHMRFVIRVIPIGSVRN